MKLPIQSDIQWSDLPLIKLLIAEWQVWKQERKQPHYSLASMIPGPSGLSPYAIDMDHLLNLPFGYLDESGVLYNSVKDHPAGYHPTSIAQYALALWNSYLKTGDQKYRDAFMIQANWLIEHESPLPNGAGGWPIPFALPTYGAPPMWLSALTQGNAISVLIRVYQLTGNEVFYQAARRAVHTFEMDIQDGGVAAHVDENGVFFEEVACEPAAHVLNGYILALFGLYDYVSCTADSHINALIEQSLATFHTLIDEYDTGYWSRYDLHFRAPVPPFYHALHITLLEALARLSGCHHCAALAAKWKRYQHSRSSYLKYLIASRALRYRRKLQRDITHLFFGYTKLHKYSN